MRHICRAIHREDYQEAKYGVVIRTIVATSAAGQSAQLLRSAFSQKTSLPQFTQFVSRALLPDMEGNGHHPSMVAMILQRSSKPQFERVAREAFLPKGMH